MLHDVDVAVGCTARVHQSVSYTHDLPGGLTRLLLLCKHALHSTTAKLQIPAGLLQAITSLLSHTFSHFPLKLIRCMAGVSAA
jgi:hypothetical protein